MSRPLPTVRGAVPALVCSLLGWMGALVILAMLLSEKYVHYLIAIPPGIPTGILVVSPPVILLWLVGVIWGWVALARIAADDVSVILSTLKSIPPWARRAAASHRGPAFSWMASAAARAKHGFVSASHLIFRQLFLHVARVSRSRRSDVSGKYRRRPDRVGPAGNWLSVNNV